MELRKIAINGHSWQITMPRPMLERLTLRPGDVVAIELVDETIVVSRAVSARQRERDELAALGRRRAGRK